MDASGSTVDMYATLNIERNNLPSNLKFYTTEDHKSELHKYYSFLEKNGTNKEKLTVYWYWNPYVDDSEDSNYMNRNISTTINVKAVQISEYATLKNGFKESYWDDSSGESIKVDPSSEFLGENYKAYIRTINFGNDLSNLPSSCTEDNLCWDISESSTQKKKVYGYLIDSGLTISENDSSTGTEVNKQLYNLYIASAAPIFAPNDCSHLFSSFNSLTSINFNNNFNTSNVTDMNYMFAFSSSLKSLDLSNFNTTNVTNMEYMFSGCYSLTSLDLSNFNTSNVTDMSFMFSTCSLTSLNLSNFNTSNATNMHCMFMCCSSLTSLDLSNFNTSNVTNMQSMFNSCTSLTSLDVSNFNTSNVTNIGSIFVNCPSLTSLDISNFNTSNVTNMSLMFENCSSLTSIDVSNFDTSNVTTMADMFSGCYSLTSLDLSNFDTSKLTSMWHMFCESTSLTTLELSSFNTINVTDWTMAFYGCTKINTTITIRNASITDYADIFRDAATDPNAKIIVNYTSEIETLVDNMIATKSTNSNVIKGKQI